MSFLTVFLAALSAVAAGFVLLLALAPLAGLLMRSFASRFLDVLIRDTYAQNLFGLWNVMRRLGPQTFGETMLRAGSKGRAISRPMGSPLHLSPWERLLFTPAQLGPSPLNASEEVDLSVTIGPAARRPLQVAIPLLVTGMSYGGALTEKAKIALARAANRVGTATNTGEAYLPAERREARRLIMQYHRGTWPNSPQQHPQLLAAADAIEIQVGQGAQAAAPMRTRAQNVDRTMRRVYGLDAGQDALIDGRFQSIASASELRALIGRLREEYPVPIGVKLAAAQTLERDLDRLLEAQPDFICLDGAEGGTHGGPVILQDDFGLPTLHAIARADRHLREAGQRGRLSLIAAGGLHTPGHCLKALALGADACYMGTTLMLAFASDQAMRAIPYEPPYSLFLEIGNLRQNFSIDRAADRAGDYLRSSAAELELGLRALGKRSLAELSRYDMIALDPFLARLTGCALPLSPEVLREEEPLRVPPLEKERRQRELH